MRKYYFILAFLLTLIFSWVALAQSMPRSQVVKSLAEQHGEKSVAWGLIAGGSLVIEVFRSAGGSTWSIVVTDQNNKSVLIMSGKHWTEIPFKEFPCPRGNLCLDARR